MMTKVQWTESNVFQLLRQRFRSPAFVLLPQVRNGTGYARTKERWADAIAVSVYPSRGLSLTGLEIKVTKSDWRKELANPDKAAPIQKYCRYWYVVAPKGIIPPSEVPDTWGLLECTEKRVYAIKEALRNQETPVDMLLLCSILRKVAEVSTPADEVRLLVEKAKGVGTDLVSEAVRCERLEYELDCLKETVKRFQEASGVKIETRWDVAKIGDAVRLVTEHGVENTVLAAKRLKTTAELIVRQLEADLDVLSDLIREKP